MANDTNELTAEQYKIEVLKARIGQVVAEYEEKIANYELALAQARQQAEGQQVE